MFQEKVWERVCLPTLEWNDLWELFHENSKLSPYGEYLSEDEVQSSMQASYDVLPYGGLPAERLPPDRVPTEQSLLTLLARRASSGAALSGPVALEQLATILQYSYGVTRSSEQTGYAVPFRAVPSAGALYPLDLYVAARDVTGLPGALYHFDPHARSLTRLGGAERCEAVAQSFVQKDVSGQAAVLLLMGATFARSTFKYGARGYRFTLIEAGHVAQNACLVSAAFGLGSRCLGGFMDRDLDRALDFNGLTQSAVYAVAIGGAEPAAPT